MNKGLAGLGMVGAGVLVLYELTWVGRSGLAWVIVWLAVCIVLVGASIVFSPKRQTPRREG